MVVKTLMARRRNLAISNLFAGRKDVVLSILLSALMLLCIAPLQLVDNYEISAFEISETSGRDSVFEGDWAAYRQVPATSFALDNQNDYIAIQDYYIINIYHNSDWNVLIDTIELGIYGVGHLEFSPNGEYLVVTSGAQFEIYQTSDWEWVYSNDVAPDDGSYVSIYDLTWSGDGQRLVFSTGNSGGEKMYEGPEWSEVDGTSSSGYYVAHHPSEDILWYLSSDGSGNEYEYESIPFVGYQWVMKRSFSLSGNPGPLTSSPDGSIILKNSDYGISAHSSSDYTELFSSSYDAEHATFSSDGNYILYYDNGNYDIYSTTTWQKMTTIDGPEEDCYYDGAKKLRFTSNDSEILVASEQCYEDFLIGWMPDYDSDGVVNQQDICPGTPEEEESDVKGCAPSQKDTDLDGVNDRDDVCPRTATSDSANSVGCSESQLIDTDGDGVSDSDDICPETPSSEYGNIYGCSKSQRDVDGDGLVDSLDNCPLYDVEACPNVLSWALGTEPVDGSEALSNLQWSPKGDSVSAYDTDSGNIFILGETLSFVQEISLQNESQQIILSDWSRNGEWLLILWGSSNWEDSNCGYYIWDAITQNLSPSYEISNDCDYFTSYAISPDGTRLAASYFSYDSYSGRIKMLEISSNLLEFEDEDHDARQLIFSHDGTTLIGSTSREIFLWDVYDGYLLQSKSIGSFDSMILSPDGDSIFTWNDEIIKVYSLNTLELKSTTSVEGKWNASYIDISLTFSRSSELLYVSLIERTRDENWNPHYNSSINTYQVGMDQSLEYITSTDAVNISYSRWPKISPDGTAFIIQLKGESGIYWWESDSDGDWIADISDLCQYTNLNESSDETGCSWEQKDDDEDGVINKQDLCFNTPIGIGMIVDEVGCSDQQVDEDFDGICDDGAASGGPSDCVGEDSCPSTPYGKVVDSTGCSWEQQDEDSDSVQNSIDICPYTSSDEIANSEGCGETQRDSDGDFVNDFWDVCTTTEINSTVDELGCSDIQVDADSDSICNSNAPSSGPSNCTSSDVCPDTESNQTVDSSGCSWEQRDDDNDGILNPIDECPDTSDNDVSPNGCSSWQRDSDNDGIVDFLDECAKTPESEFSNQVGCSESQLQSDVESKGSGGISGIQWVAIGGSFLVIMLLTGLVLSRKKPLEKPGPPEINAPQYATRGVMRGDGREWIEFPAGSGNQFYRDPTSGQWVNNE